MATSTLGTAATTTLTSLVYYRTNAIADFATVQSAIKDDRTGLILPGAFSPAGQLIIPGRGVLKLLAGDYVAVNPANGWPILVSAQAAASADWVYS